MPPGYAITVLFVAAAVASALWPRPTHGPRQTPTFVLGTLGSEVPFMLAWYLLLVTWLSFDSGDLATPASWITAAVAALVLLGLIRIVRQSAQAGQVLASALTSALGEDRPRANRGRHRLRAAWALTAPFRLPDPRIRRERNIAYGPAPGRANLLDVYRRRGAGAGPVLIYFHPGGFSGGSKNRQSKLMLETLALHGWTCISANYRLRTDYWTILADAKRVIAWTRTEGRRHGADPAVLITAGGSAGANLAAACALSAGRADLQPGFEEADTSVSAVVGLYGYYGEVFGQPGTQVSDLTGSSVPPVLIVHGEKDPMASAAGAREFTARLRDRRQGPVAYAELPGAVHNFDLFASLRHAAVTTAVLEFVTTIAREPEASSR